MIKELFEILLSFVKSRIFILALICSVLFGVLIYRVFDLQIVNSDKYQSQYNQKSEKTRYYTGTRGNIYDADGNLLAYNKPIYSVSIEDTLDSSKYKSEQLNTIIYKTISLIEKNGDSLINDFVIVIDENGELKFSDSYSVNSKNRFLKNIYGVEVLDTEEIKHSEESAYDTYLYLRDKKYLIDKDLYTQEEILKIMMIRYNLSLNSYQKYIYTTIAKDVSEKTVAAIYESEADIPGVKIQEDTVRVYNNSMYFAHILGYTGKISEENLVSLNDRLGDDELKYELNDIVGKSGVESYFELELNGSKGYDKVIVNTTGKVISVDEYVEPGSGDDVYLTIKSDLQIGIYHIIEQHLANILLDKIVNHRLSDSEEKDWMIDINSVYFQMINNNVLDIGAFNNEDATDNEKNTFELMDNYRTKVLEYIKSELNNENAKTLENYTEEYRKYFSHIYDNLVAYNVVQKSKLVWEDETYTKWRNGQMSLRDFLKYLVANNCIDTAKLKLDEQYSDSEKILEALVVYAIDKTIDDTDFIKLLYKNLINNGKLTGKQICLLLYDQEVLDFEDGMYSKLKNGTISAFDFMYKQIESLKITPAQIALTPCSSSCTLVDPSTGKIIAMVSYPSYDNNIFSGSIDSKNWNKLTNDLSSPLYSRATKMRTAPGSTLKMLSSVTGLEEGVVNEYTKIQTHGIYKTVYPSPKCWVYPGSHGNINIVKAIEVSCNYFFYEVGYRIASKTTGSFNEPEGIDILRKYGQMFGLTEKSGVEIEEYEPLFSNENVIASFIGQGTHSFTGVQLARYVNTIAANGINSELTLLDSVRNVKGDVVKLPDNEHNQIDISTNTLKIVKNGMQEAAKGYAAFKKLNFTVAAKTGTAQESKSSPNHALCVGYAPYENPQISFSVNIQHGYTSSYATKLTADVLKFYFGEITLEQILAGDANGPKIVEAETN